MTLTLGTELPGHSGPGAGAAPVDRPAATGPATIHRPAGPGATAVARATSGAAGATAVARAASGAEGATVSPAPVDRVSTPALRQVADGLDPGALSFRAGVGALLVVSFVALLALQHWVWPTDTRPHGTAARVLRDLCWLWVLNALPATVGLLGMLTMRGRRRVSRATATPIPTTVCFRVVTRGTNVRAVCETVRSISEAMAALPLFPYRVEVVTDDPIVALDAAAAELIVVPKGYETPRGTRFKARALQYALEHSDLPSDAWILHLDEESRVDASTVVGVRHAVEEEEASGAHRIGQGMILYHRDLADHPFLTLADSVRTGDDLGRFALQHRMGWPVFGLHGSFILVRCDVERQVGFDLGAAGSVTEDAYWALLEMQLGRRTRWVDGVVIEQSTQSARDFLKQRRRWFVGLTKTLLHAPVGRWRKLALSACMTAWAVSWVCAATAVLVALGHVSAPPVAFCIGAWSLSVYVLEYVVGLRVNLAHRGTTTPGCRALLYLSQVVLMPVFSALEIAGVLYAVVRPESGFHVVKK